ncbi:hypothetical protein VPH35_059901 [Triticum aestivum]
MVFQETRSLVQSNWKTLQALSMAPHLAYILTRLLLIAIFKSISPVLRTCPWSSVPFINPSSGTENSAIAPSNTTYVSALTTTESLVPMKIPTASSLQCCLTKPTIKPFKVTAFLSFKLRKMFLASSSMPCLANALTRALPT